MSAYGSYLERARRAAAMVSGMEAAIARNPVDRSLRLNLASAQMLADRAEEEFLEVARSEHVDVCRYKLVATGDDEFGLRGVSRSLDAFQEMFAHVYDAHAHGPRQRAGIPPERRQEAALEFGYSFAGSLGVVLLAPGQLNLFDSKFDIVIQIINQIFDVRDDDELRDAAQRIGKAAVQKVYEWSQINFGSGFEVDLQWLNPASIHRGRYIPRSNFERVSSIIGQTSDKEVIPISTTGLLVGFNSVMKTFHLVEPDGDSFKGHLEDAFPLTREWTVNQMYDAVIIAEATTRYATGEEVKHYRLRELKPYVST